MPKFVEICKNTKVAFTIDLNAVASLAYHKKEGTDYRSDWFLVFYKGGGEQRFSGSTSTESKMMHNSLQTELFKLNEVKDETVG